MCSFENKWLKECPHSLKPVSIDGMLMTYLYSFFHSIIKFEKYLSSKHPNINLLLEKENNGRLSFSDTNVFCEKGNLSLICIWKRPSVVVLLISTSSYLMFFNSIKEINMLRKGTNRLLKREMSDIYLKVTIEKNWRSQNFDFLSLKTLSLRSVFGDIWTHADIIEF